ncbi:DAR GTPase 2, mitochondrial [Magnolia sinica]|uniref:DAR GTPase 2, mitochondrial n=1 Tax=Magnolia sinica TaxID=86752 RepID=UPI002659A2E7|nr:DAR GTPase 2, mitochondrial [Magnolia sinica]
MAATAIFARRLGTSVKDAGAKKGSGWFGPHMAAASQAILERIPMVDLTIEIRDSRIPFSSAYGDLDHLPSSSRRMIVLNKMDLADRSQTKKWVKHFEEQNCICYAVNSHNKDNIKELLLFIQAQIREIKGNQSNYTATAMLVGIPNVGKSAISNSLHQIGRISAAEKGKLKHAVISPFPGETKDISSFKIASHPNIYILDTPGVLASKSLDVEMGSKLALTGAIEDYLVGEYELAQYFLAILHSSDDYKHWEKLCTTENDRSPIDHTEKLSVSSDSDKRRQKQYSTDHTQDFIVRDVRQALFKTISSFNGNLETEKEMMGLIEAQFAVLHEAFRVLPESGEDGCRRVATKLLNLYRTGRLGHYTLDPVPRNFQ